MAPEETRKKPVAHVKTRYRKDTDNPPLPARRANMAKNVHQLNICWLIVSQRTIVTAREFSDSALIEALDTI